MHLTYRNVSEAFHEMVRAVRDDVIPVARKESRFGDVLQIEEPMTITYEKPWERALNNPIRDCNPFFHVFESIWMLAGRQDVESVSLFTSKMKQFSDDGTTFHGAYGYRWRYQFGWDQLNGIIQELRDNPISRRCVLQMWDATVANPYVLRKDDFYMATHGGKDVPCNTCAYFMVNRGRLDLTVCNRSNDMILGMFGANAVHMSYLHEYIANCAGLEMGRYNQFSNNLHIYTANWKPKEWLEGEKESPTFYKSCPHKLVRDKEDFDQGCEMICQDLIDPYSYSEPYLKNVVSPMLYAFERHTQRDYSTAFFQVDMIEDEQWRWAAKAWLVRRQANWEKKNAKASTDEA